MLRKILVATTLAVLVSMGVHGQGRQNLPGGVDPAAGRGADTNLLTRLPTPAQWDANPRPRRTGEGRGMAGTDADLKFDYGCSASLQADRSRPTGVPRRPGGRALRALPAPNPDVVMPPQHLFDNFWWFGNTSIGAGLATTNDGTFCFDTMGE